MKKARFNYWKLTAVVAVLAITIIAGVRPSTATKQPPLPAAAASADLANEERALAKYCDDLAAYHKQTAELAKRVSLVKADLDPIQRRSDDLKLRLSGLQNVIREIVNKLKAANEWNDLDATAAAGITDASQKAFFEQDSFRQLLEESSNNLTSHGNEISIPVDNLRKRLASRTFSPYGGGTDFHIVRAAYEAPVPAKFYSVGCSVQKIRFGLIGKLGGTATNATLDAYSCSCGATTGSGTLTKCKDLGY